MICPKCNEGELIEYNTSKDSSIGSNVITKCSHCKKIWKNRSKSVINRLKAGNKNRLLNRQKNYNKVFDVRTKTYRDKEYINKKISVLKNWLSYWEDLDQELEALQK